MEAENPRFRSARQRYWYVTSRYIMIHTKSPGSPGFITASGLWMRSLTLINGPDSEVLPGPTFRILASCMHAGVRILEVRRAEGGKWLINVLAKFVEHESMVYASDGRPRYGGGELAGFTVVSTSFYDKKLCVWETEFCRRKE